jgi:hypothetical protein
MNPFDTGKDAGWSETWARSGQAFLDAQRSLFEAMAQGGPQDAAAPPPVPDLQAFHAAQSGFRRALANAEAMSTTFVAALATGEGGHDPAAMRIMAKVFDPREWLTGASESDEAVGRRADGMGLAGVWDLQRRFAELTAAWLALRCRNLEHDTLMIEAWSRAGQRYAQALEERGEAGTAPQSARALAALWAEIADETLRETQRGEAFLEGQRKTLKASTDLRLAQQAVGDVYARMFGYPTRAEIDDVHRSLTELRREVRALTRQTRSNGTKGEASDAEGQRR